MVEISTSNCGKTTQKIRFYQKIPRGRYGKKGAFSSERRVLYVLWIMLIFFGSVCWRINDYYNARFLSSWPSSLIKPCKHCHFITEPNDVLYCQTDNPKP